MCIRDVAGLRRRPRYRRAMKTGRTGKYVAVRRAAGAHAETKYEYHALDTDVSMQMTSIGTRWEL